MNTHQTIRVRFPKTLTSYLTVEDYESLRLLAFNAHKSIAEITRDIIAKKIKAAKR